MVYLKDRLISSKSQTKQIADVSEVLTLLNNAGVLLDIKILVFYGNY